MDDIWDAFDSEEEEETTGDDYQRLVQILSQQLMQQNSQIPLKHRHVLLLSSSCTNDTDDELKKALKETDLLLYTNKSDHDLGRRQQKDSDSIPFTFDAIICIDNDITKQQLVDATERLVPGGILFLQQIGPDNSTFVNDTLLWKPQSQCIGSSSSHTLWIKRHAQIQTAACRWFTTTSLHEEHSRLEQATPVVSIHERQHQTLNSLSIRRAVHALRTYGYTVVSGLIPRSDALAAGAAVLHDVHTAAQQLLQTEGVDLYHPHESSREPAAYYELSMREDLRLDLRHGPALNQWRQTNKNTDKSANHSRVLTVSDTPSDEFLRQHPSILEIVRTAMNPSDPTLAQGNVGRYNFANKNTATEQTTTTLLGTPQDIRVGPVGGIVTLPGAADQALHADTPHLFEHSATALPPHYINCFTPGCDADSSVGQTAILHGTHRLDVVAACYNNRRALWKGHLVRPVLQLSDVLIFDCRILHFGMANESKTIERPLLYTNMTLHWFHDPKNWDDRKRIFDDRVYEAEE